MKEESFSEGPDGHAMSYAFYEPENASASNLRPLVIWLHGGGEGGTDPRITCYGNKTVALFGEEFQQTMDEAGQDPQKAKQMAALLAYQDMAHGQKTADVKRDNDYTTQVLYRLGFAWSPTSWDYVERMLTAIGGFGFFE